MPVRCSPRRSERRLIMIRGSRVSILLQASGMPIGSWHPLSARRGRACWRRREALAELRSRRRRKGETTHAYALDDCAGAEERAEEVFCWRRATIWNPACDSLLDVAHDHLTLARAALYRALVGPPADSAPAATPLGPRVATALDRLRQANQVQFLPKALLTAALYHGALGSDPEEARRMLDEAEQIAERGPMPLYLADVHLHRARLFRDRAALAEARALIERHGYGRRRDELADAEAAAVHW